MTRIICGSGQGGHTHQGCKGGAAAIDAQTAALAPCRRQTGPAWRALTWSAAAPASLLALLLLLLLLLPGAPPLLPAADQWPELLCRARDALLKLGVPVRRCRCAASALRAVRLLPLAARAVLQAAAAPVH